MPTVARGDVLVIPPLSSQNMNADNRVTIRWQENLQQEEGDYYVIIVKNKSRGYEEVPFYIQAEVHDGNEDMDEYELTVDEGLQYGATNSWNLFLVWHDKDRKPFAERFIQAGLFGHDKQKAAALLKAFLGKDLGNALKDDTAAAIAQRFEVLAGAFKGVPLKTFW